MRKYWFALGTLFGGVVAYLVRIMGRYDPLAAARQLGQADIDAIANLCTASGLGPLGADRLEVLVRRLEANLANLEGSQLAEASYRIQQGRRQLETWGHRPTASPVRRNQEMSGTPGAEYMM